MLGSLLNPAVTFDNRGEIKRDAEKTNLIKKSWFFWNIRTGRKLLVEKPFYT